MPRCCDEERSTPFCPICGKVLQKGLYVLLTHLDANVKTHERRIRSWVETQEEETDDRRRASLQRKIDLRAKTLSKWQGWHDALKRLLDPDTAPPDTPA